MRRPGPGWLWVDKFKSIRTLDDTDRGIRRVRESTRRRIWRMDHGGTTTCAAPVHRVDGLLPCRGRILGELPDDESSRLWRGCGVFDFSTLGVGMDFRHNDPADVVGRRISVRLSVGESIDIAFTGVVRNIKAGPDGIVRAGIEFVGLSEDELYIVDLLELGSLTTPAI